MIQINVPKPEYDDPWVIPFAERAQQLRRRGKKIFYYSEKPNNSSFRYRAFNMAETINRSQSEYSASWFWESDGSKLLNLVKEASILIVHRALYRDFVSQLISVAKANNIPVVYDVDDFVFELSKVPLLVDSTNQRLSGWDGTEATWGVWFAMIGRYRAVAEMCDSVLVTNEFLAELVTKYLRKPVSVIPNYLGYDQLAISNYVYETRNAQLARNQIADIFPNRPLTIGYFSGSPTHHFDFRVAANSIASIMSKYPHTNLRVVGWCDLSGTGLEKHIPRIEQLPFTDYLDLQRLIGEVDVNVSPLVENIFTNGKSELKYFDAGVVGVPTLATPTFTMRKAIRQLDNGMLVPAFGWLEALDTIISDNDLRLRLGHAAREDSVARYTPQAQTPPLLTYLDSL